MEVSLDWKVGDKFRIVKHSSGFYPFDGIFTILSTVYQKGYNKPDSSTIKNPVWFRYDETTVCFIEAHAIKKITPLEELL